MPDMCKGNYTLCVKEKMFCDVVPEKMDWGSVFHFNVFTIRGISGRPGQKELEVFSNLNIIRFTYRHASFFSKTGAAPSGRRAERQIRRRHGRVVSAGRVFRSRRFGASQVRDAAASATRGTDRDPSRSNLWLFPAF